VGRNSRKEVYLIKIPTRFSASAGSSGGEQLDEGVSSLEGRGGVTIYWRLCGQYGLNHARDMHTNRVVA